MLVTLFHLEMLMSRLPLALACCLAAGCSWVTLEKGARDVLVLPAERLAADCVSQGKVTVSVMDKVGVLERHDEEVVEDLDVLARNHAAKQGADTVVARGPVTDGARSYEIFRCMEKPQGERAPQDAASPQEENVEVLPYDGADN